MHHFIGSDTCVRRLLDKGANVTSKDSLGKTALDYVLEEYQKEGISNASTEGISKTMATPNYQNYSNTIALLIEANSSTGNEFSLFWLKIATQYNSLPI